MFFRSLSDAAGSMDDQAALLALWELVWAGLVTNDTIAPLRALTGGTRAPSRPTGSRRRRPAMPVRTGPPAAAGRWSLVPQREADSTRRLTGLTEQLLNRYGIVTRGAVMGERVPGSFAAVYPVLKAMEDRGTCRRGYFVDGMGGAQFALPGAVDRMRSLIDVRPEDVETVVLASTDPANPYGTALPWPDREGGHRAGRKAGSVVVLVDGELVIYVEKGGRTLLSYTDDEDILQPAVDALALAARDGALGRLHVERADGEEVHDTAFAKALVAAGFKPSSRGLRLRA